VPKRDRAKDLRVYANGEWHKVSIGVPNALLNRLFSREDPEDRAKAYASLACQVKARLAKRGIKVKYKLHESDFDLQKWDDRPRKFKEDSSRIIKDKTEPEKIIDIADRDIVNDQLLIIFPGDPVQGVLF
jgi:hypothetical protein